MNSPMFELRTYVCVCEVMTLKREKLWGRLYNKEHFMET